MSVLRQRLWANNYRCVAYATMRCRLQQLTEFDCFVKSFAYLAARLPRSDLIEPFLDEAIVEPLEHVQKQFEIMKKSKELLTSGDAVELNEDAFMAGMKMATGKPPEADIPAKDVSLSEAHPDVYPCLLAMCGSGFAFYKVMLYIFIIATVIIISTVMNSTRNGQSTFYAIVGIYTVSKKKS